jgi:hypothetical protein
MTQIMSSMQRYPHFLQNTAQIVTWELFSAQTLLMRDPLTTPSVYHLKPPLSTNYHHQIPTKHHPDNIILLHYQLSRKLFPNIAR